MSRFVILLGGALVRTAELEAEIAGARVIAADSGMKHASFLGVVPELWVGDFDSVSDELLDTYADTPRAVYPVEKDKTDGELAIDAALERGASELILVGAFGGDRPDHTFFHLTQAIHFSKQGTPTLLSSGAQTALALINTQDNKFEYPDGTLFSILPFSDLSGLSVKGAKWPLHEITVPFGSSLTMSNHVEGDLTITLEQGSALLLVHHDVKDQED